MEIRRNARAVSLLALLFALLTATVAFAEDGVFDDPRAEDPACEEVVVDDGGTSESTDPGITDPRGGGEVPAEEPAEEPAECEEPGEEPGEDPGEEPGEGEEGEEPTEEPAEEPAAEPIDEPTEEELRIQACEAAAGLVEEEPVDGEVVEEEKLTGLDNAIDRVLTNCIENPQAPGLLNALERLTENRERHETHMEAVAAAKAEREAAKAERTAAHQAWKAEKAAAKAGGGHGISGSHGNSGTHGNGGGNGNGHGNPH
jgi:hypothetical protein